MSEIWTRPVLGHLDLFMLTDTPLKHPKTRLYTTLDCFWPQKACIKQSRKLSGFGRNPDFEGPDFGHPLYLRNMNFSTSV